jgi:ribosomal protein S18 acetylase RimI-like enzyme
MNSSASIDRTPRRSRRRDHSMADLSRQEKARDPIWKTWTEVHDRTASACRWTRELVKERLKEAHQVFMVQAGRIGPKEYGTAMPAPMKDELDIWWERSADEAQRLQDAKEQNRTRFAPTVEQCSRADGALYFQSRYLAGTKFDLGHGSGPLFVLNIYLYCLDARERFPDALHGCGIHPSTGYRHLDQGLLAIAIGLMEDKVLNGVIDHDPLPQRQGIVVLPDWWWEVDLLLGCQDETPEDRLKMADIIIGERVKEELGGRSLSNKLNNAEYRGRCTFLRRLLRERLGKKVS